MKDYTYVPGWRQNKENNKPAIKHSVLMFTTHGIAEGEWVGNEWVQYRWSCKVKDTEVLYWMHLEDLTQLEKEGDCFQQEQPEVDLEKYIENEINHYGLSLYEPSYGTFSACEIDRIIRKGFELGLNARKEE